MEFPAFSGRVGLAGRDRGHALRSQPEALLALQAQAQFLVFWRGMVLAGESGLALTAADHPLLGGMGAPVFLGFHEERPVFGAEIAAWQPEEGIPDAQAFDSGKQAHPLAPPGAAFTELRRIMALLSPDEAELAAAARALLEWHRGHSFCPACGGGCEAGGGGWHRKCRACSRMHFPRTDPVVIMLVARGDNILLGRSPGWPEGMYSTLAGFIEPGETAEAAVRREVLEETGVICGAVRYLISQPWPFPASLMLGFAAEAESDEITLDPVELEDAFWIGRAELAQMMAGAHPRLRAPRPGSIAAWLLANWLARPGE